jgi:hypothetical protein
MAEFSPIERASQKRIVGLMMKGDPAKKAHYDAALTRLVESLHKSMPSADKDTLAEFSTSIAFIAGVLMKTPVEEIGPTLQELFDSYEIAAAYFIGVYDPANPEVPNVEEADLGALFGVDDETIQKFREFTEAQKHDHTKAGPVNGQYI